MIILDTLARCFGGNDENDARDMGAFIRGCDELKRRTGATVLVVHHSGKDETKGHVVPVHFVHLWTLNTVFAVKVRTVKPGYLLHQNEGRGGTERGCI